MNDPQKLVLNGSISRIPFVIGVRTSCCIFRIALLTSSWQSCEDEGTIFSLFNSFIVWYVRWGPELRI